MFEDDRKTTVMPSLNALRAFEVVSRQLNFRLAGEELGVTQGAVAQQIRALEADLGLRLFERHARGLNLTDAGGRYAVSIHKAFELIAEATEALRPGSVHLTISVTPTFAARWLIPHLSDFSAQYPQIDLRILATEKLSGFQHESVDLAVRYGQPPFGPGLNAELLIEPEVIAVASPQLLVERGPLTLESLARYPLLHDAHNLWPQYLQQAFAQVPQNLNRNLRFNQTSLAIDAALAGQGIALASRFFVSREIEAGRLLRPLPHSLHPQAAFYLVYPHKGREQAPLEEVRDWLLRRVNAS